MMNLCGYISYFSDIFDKTMDFRAPIWMTGFIIFNILWNPFYHCLLFSVMYSHALHCIFMYPYCRALAFVVKLSNLDTIWNSAVLFYSFLWAWHGHMCTRKRIEILNKDRMHEYNDHALPTTSCVHFLTQWKIKTRANNNIQINNITRNNLRFSYHTYHTVILFALHVTCLVATCVFWREWQIWTFSNASSLMKIVVFWFKCHLHLFPMVQITIIQQYLRCWLGVELMFQLSIKAS